MDVQIQRDIYIPYFLASKAKCLYMLQCAWAKGESQTQKLTYCIIPFTRKVQNGQIHREEADSWFSGTGDGVPDGQGVFNGYRVPFGMMKLFWKKTEVTNARCECINAIH